MIGRTWNAKRTKKKKDLTLWKLTTHYSKSYFRWILLSQNLSPLAAAPNSNRSFRSSHKHLVRLSSANFITFFLSVWIYFANLCLFFADSTLKISATGRPPHYVISMDSIHDDVMPHGSLNITVHGRPVTVPGKIGNATRLDGETQFIDFGDQSDTCLGSLVHCVHHGLMLSIWVKFRRLEPGMHYLSTGGGIKVRLLKTATRIFENSYSIRT